MELVSAESQSRDQPAASQVFDKILLSVGSAKGSWRATDAALVLAQLSRSEVLVVSVVDVQLCCAGGAEDMDGAFAGLNEIVARFRTAGVACEGLVWRSVNRSVAAGLINAATEYQPSLLVLPDDRPTSIWRFTRQRFARWSVEEWDVRYWWCRKGKRSVSRG